MLFIKEESKEREETTSAAVNTERVPETPRLLPGQSTAKHYKAEIYCDGKFPSELNF